MVLRRIKVIGKWRHDNRLDTRSRGAPTQRARYETPVNEVAVIRGDVQSPKRWQLRICPGVRGADLTVEEWVCTSGTHGDRRPDREFNHLQKHITRRQVCRARLFARGYPRSKLSGAYGTPDLPSSASGVAPTTEKIEHREPGPISHRNTEPQRVVTPIPKRVYPLEPVVMEDVVDSSKDPRAAG